MQKIIVMARRRDTVEFLGAGNVWCTEYPDAVLFSTVGKARKAARRHGGVVVSDYGYDTQRENA